MRFARSSVIVLAVVVGGGGSAGAQSNPQAEELFRQGRKAMEARSYTEACEAFEGSQRLEPTVATLMNLADCREKNGQLATAWGLFLQVGTQTRDDAKQAGLRDAAGKRAVALEGRLSRLTVNVPETSRVDGLRIVRGATVIDPATWNRSLPIDGGTYEISASAPGVQPWTAKVTIATEGDSKAIDVPRFEPVIGGDVGPKPRATGPSERPTSRHRRKPLAFALGGVGIAAGGVAIVFELQGRSALGKSEDATTQADQDRFYDDANGKHHLAQGLAIAGGACIAAAVVVWVTGRESSAPSGAAIAPVVGPQHAGLAVGGSF
ncbi:MAG TPA: hypothetical protein VM261_32115 [Kofleriaceae bacterium]|nr:hypothetical protein [Kofleriaceae bacterium]